MHLQLPRAILASFGLFKLGLLVGYGPIVAPDTQLYLAIARAILAGNDAFSRVPDWTLSAAPALAFRPFGYPLVLAAATRLGGAAGPYLVILGQIGLTLFVGHLVFELARRISGSTLGAMVALLVFLGSQSMLWDQALLSDSLYAALFDIVVLILITSYLDGRVPGWKRLIGFGLLWVASILVRDTGLYFTIIPAAMIWLSTGGMPAGRPVRAVGVFLLPVVIFLPAYIGWNAYRTGEAFFSITGVANFMRPAFDMARQGWAQPFDDSSAVSAIIRAHRTDYGFDNQMAILGALHDALGLTSPLPLLAIAKAKYVETLRDHPVAYLRFVLDNLDPRSLASLFFDPVATYNEYRQIGIPPFRRVIPGLALRDWLSLLRQGDAAGLGLAALALISKMAALLALAATLGTVALRVRDERPRLRRPTIACLLLIASSLVVIGFYALVHSEDRLKLPCIALVAIVAAEAVARAARLRGPRPAGIRHRPR